MKINLLSLSKFFIYLAPLSVLIVLPSTFFPFIGGKYYFFRTVVSLSLIAFLFHWAFEDNENKVIKDLKETFKNPLVIAVSIFVLFYVLASIFAYDIKSAFWSNYERQEGGFQMIHYWLFFMLLVLLFKTERDWKTIFWISILSAIGVIFYGVLSAVPVTGFFGPYDQLIYEQKLGFWSVLFNKNMRFQGALGNPAYVAPYLMFIIFYALYLFFEKHINWKRGFFYGLSVLFFFVFFVLSQTRGAFLGLVAAIFTFFIYNIFSNKQFRKWGIYGFIFIIIVLFLLFYFKNSEFIKSLPGSRFLQIDFGERTAQTRFWTWNSAWRGFLDRPLLGWGPENFAAVFDKYFDPRHFNPNASSETWFDRAHSVIFDYLAETGILGLLGYLSVFIAFILLLFKFKKTHQEKKLISPINELQFGLLLSILIGYFVQNLIIFEVLPMYLNFFLVLGFGAYLFKPLFLNHLKFVDKDARTKNEFIS